MVDGEMAFAAKYQKPERAANASSKQNVALRNQHINENTINTMCAIDEGHQEWGESRDHGVQKAMLGVLKPRMEAL
jgi:hypothetical protein